MKTAPLLLCCFFALFIGTAQDESLELLFENKKYDSIISILTKKESKKELSMREYFILTRSYGRTNQFPNGYVLASKMIEAATRKKDTINLLKAFNLKAEQITDLHKITEGVKFCDSVIPLFRKQDSIQLMNLYFKCGILYHYNNQHEKAYESYKKITAKKYTNLTLYSTNFGLILTKLEKDEEAITFLEKSIKHHNANGELQYINKPLLNIGQIYLTKKEWKKSKIYLDSAYNSLTSVNTLYDKKVIFVKYFNLYQLQGKTKKATQYLDSIFYTNQDLLVKKIGEEINSINAANEHETFLVKKVKVIDNKLSEFENQKLKGIIILLSIILLLLSILFVFIYKNIRSTYKNAITEQRLRWSKMNPDFLFSSLSLLQNMITTKEPKSIKYLSKFSKFLRLVLESSRENLISIEDELAAIKYYMELQQMNTSIPIDFKMHTEENLEEKEISIPPMLIQPFIEMAIHNSIHSKATGSKITISTSFAEDKLTCIIEDNGTETINKNLKKEEIIKNTKERLKIFSKKFKVFVDLKIENIHTHHPQGTKVSITLPYKQEI